MGGFDKKYISQWGWVVILFMGAALVLLGSGAGMRESDQASIITGALDIAWGGDIIGNEAYRYDKFFGSYWLLAFWYKIWGVTEGHNPDRVVGLGNAFAALMYLVGLTLLIWKVRFSLWSGLVAWIALSAPVLLLSAPFLSPNVISIGFLFIVAYLLKSGRSNLWVTLGIVVASFFAVSCRIDAVFLMPLLCWASEKVKVWRLWQSKNCCAMLVGSISAIVGSQLVGIGHGSGIGESFFFVPKVAAAYLVFGLWASLGMLLIFVMWLMILKRPKYVLLSLALLLPIAFYVGLLFTPRHLILVPVGLLLSLLLPRGQRLWHLFLSKRLARVTVTICAIASTVALFCGVNMPQKSEVNLSFNGRVTLYPTADGYWPMGATVQFLYRLKDSASEPVDYNQQIWGAWSSYTFDAQGHTKVAWDRLYRYPELAAKIRGVNFSYTTELEEGAVFVGRAYTKGDVKLNDFSAQELLSKDGQSIYQARKQASSNSLFSAAFLVSASLSERNDFLLFNNEDEESQEASQFFYGNDVIVLSERVIDEINDDYLGRFDGLHVYRSRWTEASHSKLKGKEGVWVAVFYLPSYMKVSNYES